MDFDRSFEIFVSWQSAVLCLGIYVITYVIRTLVETFWKGAKANRYWNEAALPLGPIGTGVLLSVFAKKFPWPMMAATATTVPLSARMLYCMVCGLASGWFYNRLRAWMKASSDAGTPPVVFPQAVEFPTPQVNVTVNPVQPSKPEELRVGGDVAPSGDDKEAP